MKILGTLYGLTSSGSLSEFVVRAENGQEVRVQAPQALLSGLAEGDMVEVEGKSQTDPPFLADSVVKVHAKPPVLPKKLPWKWIAAAAVVLVIIVGALAWPKQSPSSPAPVVVAGGSAAPAAPVIPAAPAVPGGRVLIVNAHSGLCITPAGGGRDANGGIVQFTCDQDPSRVWRFDVIQGDIVKLVNVNSGLCLTIAGGVSDRNATSVQFPCDEDPSRRWRYSAIDASTFRLINVNSGQCLTVAGGALGVNTPAVQFPCDDDPSRNWKIRS